MRQLPSFRWVVRFDSAFLQDGTKAHHTLFEFHLGHQLGSAFLDTGINDIAHTCWLSTRLSCFLRLPAAWLLFLREHRLHILEPRLRRELSAVLLSTAVLSQHRDLTPYCLNGLRNFVPSSRTLPLVPTHTTSSPMSIKIGCSCMISASVSPRAIRSRSAAVVSFLTPTVTAFFKFFLL